MLLNSLNNQIGKHNASNRIKACPKSPLLLMNPQETRVLESDEVHRPWVETPFTVSKADVASSAAIPFSLQSYLDEENGLERCIAGVADEGPCLSSRYRVTARSVVQHDTQSRRPVLVADGGTDAGRLDTDYIKVDYEELIRVPAPGATTMEAGLDAMVHEVISLDSMSTFSGAASTASSQSSCRSLLDPSRAPASSRLRYASLHRQLQEAGLAGLGDGTNSIELYHR